MEQHTFLAPKPAGSRWTTEEDNFIYEELNRHPHKLPHEIATYIYSHPLFKNRTYGGLYQHVDWLRIKSKTDKE